MKKATIENYFNSQDFLKVLEMVTPENPSSLDITRDIGALMEKAFNFMKLTNFTAKPEQVTDFLVDIAEIHNITSDHNFNLNFNYNTAFLEHYCKTNSIDFNQVNSPDYAYIKADLAFSLASNGYKFHGTNDSFIPSIKEKGLLPNQSPNQDIEEINQIFLSHGRPHMFPWKTSDRGNEVFFSTTPKESYAYAVRSPEWFDVFVGNNYYQTRDYEKAKENVQSAMKQYDLTEQEQEKVSNFFEKYWDIYAKGNPTIIAIPEPTEESLDLADFAVEMAEQTDSAEHALETGFCVAGIDSVDASTKDKIDISDAMFIEMPNIAIFEHQIATIRAENKIQQENETQQNQNIDSDISMELN